MGLASDLAAPAGKKRTRPCEFGAWIDSLPTDDAAAVRVAIARTPDDPLYWPMPRVTARLLKAGFQGSGSTVYKHRRNECHSCRD